MTGHGALSLAKFKGASVELLAARKRKEMDLYVMGHVWVKTHPLPLSSRPTLLPSHKLTFKTKILHTTLIVRIRLLNFTIHDFFPACKIGSNMMVI